MDRKLATPISGDDGESITIRERDLSTEIMGEMTFGEAAFLIITGTTPTPAESEVFETMLASLLAHGLTSHTVATRVTYGAEPNSVQGAVASGLLGVGSRSAGAVRQCTEQLQRLQDQDHTDESVENLVSDAEPTEPFGVTGFSGVGHGSLEQVDPRAQTILNVASESGIAGDHTALLEQLRQDLEHAVDRHLPVNVIGAISAVGSDMGLSPVAVQGIAILSRTAGLLAEVEEETKNPMAGDIRQLIRENSVYSPQADQE
ncbi:citryl-CoA lyase [Halobellus sp. GM3]|uniref:citryl-CoA lyase n=1 Tax=Halobellus sp. GM3 TaxID=3458410 RepID=UPI00403D72CA